MRRHGQPHVLAQECDEPTVVVSLERLHVRLEKRPLGVLGIGGCRPLEPCCRKSLLQRRTRTLKRTVHGGKAHLEHRSGVVRWPVERIAKDQDRSLSRRKMLDRCEECELDRLSHDGGVVRLRALVDEAVGVRLQPREVGRRNRTGAEIRSRAFLVWHEAPRPALEDPEAGVGRDPIEPGSERRAPVVRLAAAPGAEEGVLDCVLGVLERAEHPVGVHLQLGAMPFDERRKRSGVAPRRRGDQPLVEPD